MKCSVTLKINYDVVKQIQDAALTAMELTAEAVLSDINARNVVPKRTGILEQSGFVDKVKEDVYAIIYSTPYARRWYFNLPITDKKGRQYQPAVFQKTQNPNAQDHWMDYYLDGEGKQWVINTFVQLWKEESGGLIK